MENTDHTSGARSCEQNAHLKGAEPVDKPKRFIVWQKDVRVEQEQKDAFVQHLVGNYYSQDPRFSIRTETVSEWINSWITKYSRQEETGYFLIDIPLLASVDKQEGWEECKIAKRDICYYRPLPRWETNCQQEDLSADNVFQKGDEIISSLVFPDDEEGESSCIYNRADMDAARGREKQAFSKLLEEIDSYKTLVEEKGRIEEERNSLQQKLNAADADKQKAVSDCENRHAQERDRLNSELNEAKEKAAQLSILEGKYSKLQKEKERIETERDSLKKKLENADADKQKAVSECENRHAQERDRLNSSLNEAKKRADENKANWSKEKSKREHAERIIIQMERELSERDETIRRKEAEMNFYKDRLAIFESVQEFGHRVMSFFDVSDTLQAELSLLKAAPPSGINEDDFNYYIARIEKKYYSVKTNNLLEWRREIQMLSLTGMVPTEGLINSKLGIDEHTGKHKVSEPQWESTLRMLLYQSVMADLAGATVVMSDELAYMLPQMVHGVRENKAFAEISEKLQKAIKDMGYELNYVKPFTQLSLYKDVENVQFTEADVPPGTIFEVMKMALNYGSTKKKTEVSAK